MEAYFTTYEKLCLESKRLDKQINSLLSQIKACPKGKLVCAKDRDHYYKWYLSDGHTSVYLPRNKRKLAEQLATKKYLSLVLEDLQNEKKAIDFYLRHHVPSKAEEFLKTPAYKELLSPSFKLKSEKLSEWMNSPFDYNNKFPEQRTHQTSSGNSVRSKSEALIDMVLSINKIPFRYECALQFGETTIYPDFTIMHPETEQIYYWEHFGMMDNPKYSRNVGDKLQLYISHGIIPSINLITTFETLDNPLTTKEIEKIVTDYFG